MNWHSLDEFLSMGGYGLYVWGSYGLVALTLVVELALAARRHRLARQQLAEANEQETAP